MTKLIWRVSWILLFFSCGQRTDKADAETVKEGNKSATLSTDTAMLSKLIDITTYKPTHAKFK